MTVAELHIDFQQKLQRVSAFTFGDYLPHEIDWILNEHQYKYLRRMETRSSNRRKEGFEDTQVRTDIYEAIKTIKLLPAYHLAENLQYVILPSNYFELIRETSSVQYNCTSLVKTLVNTNIQYLIYKYPTFTNTAHYANFTISYTINGVPTIVYNAANYATLYTFSSLDEKMYAIDHILDTLNNRTDVEVYWERYGDKYQSDSFIFVTTNSNITTVTFTINSMPVADDFTTETRQSVASTSVKKVIYGDNRLVKSEFVNRYNKNPFNKSIGESPLETLRKGQLILLTDNTFYIDSVEVEYLRRPKMINHLTGQSLELGSTLGVKRDIARQIVDMAVQTTAARIMAGNYQTISQENLLNE